VKTLSIQVPSSTSNLGPGFDLLGLALGIFVQVEAAPRVSGHDHELQKSADFAAEWPIEANLLLRAFDTVFTQAGLVAPPQSFHVSSQVPIARGLGSSGAAVAAGLLLAEARLTDQRGSGLGIAALHELGIALEGHPDNVTASLFGGCTLCLPSSSGRGGHATRWFHQEVAESLGFSVAWSGTRLSTARARGVLRADVPFADAVENPRRLAMLLEGLRTGDPELLAIGAHDRLHHDARLALIPGGRESLAAAEEAGAFMTAINGSGSSLLAIGPRERATELAEVLGNTLAAFDKDVTAEALEIVHGTPPIR
jgi:homoserine kinase